MAHVRVMTWNVQNLFDVGDDDGPDDQAALDAKLASLSAVIDTVEPHVLALQEIGNEAALTQLQGALTHEMEHRCARKCAARRVRLVRQAS